MNDLGPAGPAAWFVRRGDAISGPFARGLLRRYRALGRLAPDDQVSLDRINWFLVSEVADLAPAFDPNVPEPTSDGPVDWSRERHRARRRWMEERWRGSPDTPAAKATEDDERRSGDASLHLRPGFGPGREVPQRSKTRGIVIATAFVLLAIGAALAWLREPAPPVRITGCGAAPAPGINWEDCDLRDADLRGADPGGARLGRALLAGASLRGADLRGADLTGADLRRADLAGADLTNATLRGTRLGEAQWTHGGVCAPDSVDICPPSSP